MMLYQPELLPLVMDAITEGWARGRRAKPLLPVHWEDYWSEPLTELQAAYQLD
jgi:ubiquinone biosynthesis protein Coq4